MSETMKDAAERALTDAERFVADGIAAVKAEFANLPHRTLPTYEDVLTAMEAGFRHMMSWRSAPPAAPPAQVEQPPADAGS